MYNVHTCTVRTYICYFQILACCFDGENFVYCIVYIKKTTVIESKYRMRQLCAFYVLPSMYACKLLCMYKVNFRDWNAGLMGKILCMHRNMPQLDNKLHI